MDGTGRININVSAVNYDQTSKAISHQLSVLEEMVHSEDDFVMTDSEFAFWLAFLCSKRKPVFGGKTNGSDGI